MTNELENDSYTIVIDAGGRYGIHPTWTKYRGELRYYLFEPDPKESLRLADKYKNNPSISVQSKALGKTSRTALLNIFNHQGLNSLHNTNIDSYCFKLSRIGQGRKVGQTEISMTTIIDFCKENQIREVDFIKTDTEGHDLFVLEGAGALIDHCIGIRCEVQFESVYTNCPDFSDIHVFCKRNGFFLINLDYSGIGSTVNKFFNPESSRYGVLTGTDSTWIRKAEEVLAWPGEEKKIAIRVAKYALFCFSNQASDLAMHMLLISVGRCRLGLLSDTKLFRFLEYEVMSLFYQLLKHPAYDPGELQVIFTSLFDKPLKKYHEFYSAEEYNFD